VPTVPPSHLEAEGVGVHAVAMEELYWVPTAILPAWLALTCGHIPVFCAPVKCTARHAGDTGSLTCARLSSSHLGQPSHGTFVTAAVGCCVHPPMLLCEGYMCVGRLYLQVCTLHLCACCVLHVSMWQ
jgi:hypothetical protein